MTDDELISYLKEQVEKKKCVDVGRGVEKHIGVSKYKFLLAIKALQEEGYEIHSVYHLHLGSNRRAKTRILIGPGTSLQEAWKSLSQSSS